MGTRQTLAGITPQVLETCHRAFYTPENMVLCVVGDVDADAVAAMAREVLGDERKPVGIKEPIPEQAMDCPESLVQSCMEVAMPMFQLGFRCESVPNGPESIRQEVAGDLAAEALFGESSRLYLRLYEDGLIDSSFGGGFECLDGCSMLLCGGDSDEPDTVCRMILEEAERLAREGVGEEDFLRMKRSALGRRIRELDSFDSTCFRLCAYHMSGVDYFCFPEIYRQVEAGEIQQFLADAVRSVRGAAAILYPIEQEV